MNLPKDFLIKMKTLLNDEYDCFVNSYTEKRKHGLRINTLKVSVSEFLAKSPFALEKIPWVDEGYFFKEEERPGKHPYHEAGLYYIQEPSAMAVGEFVDPKPGENVLDLCAAPGGKTTHIAAKMNQQGFLLANDVHPGRAKILLQNVERMGITNAVITNESPARLAERFPGYFDRILVDAPCSGEGMFRKDPEACMEWSKENVEMCAIRQLDILKCAGKMLKAGGRLVYSTCTFSPEENEGVIDRFLKENAQFEVENVERYEGFKQGRPEWISSDRERLKQTVRIWPHHVQGEGHFIAALRKNDGQIACKPKYEEPLANQKKLKPFFQFAAEHLSHPSCDRFFLFGEQLYVMPNHMPSLNHLKVIRPGWHVGTIKKNRFEPSHALALRLSGDQVKKTWNLERDSKEIYAYLRGETIPAEGVKGWYLIEVDGFSIGWGKLTDHLMKNHYPKGLRWKG